MQGPRDAGKRSTVSNLAVSRCSVAHLTEQRSGQTSGCLEAFLACARLAEGRCDANRRSRGNRAHGNCQKSPHTVLMCD